MGLIKEKKMKVAIVCDWLVVYAGAEKVVEQILNLYPEADLYCLVDFIKKEDRGFLLNKKSTTSFIQNMPTAKQKYRAYLPLMPLAIEQLDVSGYDLVISSSHAVAKGILTGPNQVHISYIHSPIRYAWDMQHQYLKEAKLNKGIKSWIARLILHYIRLWDSRTANGVDHCIANSGYIARRIKKVYQREAAIIYPPVDIAAFTMVKEKEEFYLTASRMVPYKKIRLIVEAFNEMPEKELIVIGDGPEYKRIKEKAGKNIQLLGYQAIEVLKEKMQKAKAFVFASEEDFGITPVEAQACGTPVIAYGKGGTRETVRGMGIDEKPTGVLFEKQEKDAIVEAIRFFEENRAAITAENCRENAKRFGIERFRNAFKQYVDRKMKEAPYG